MFLQVVQECKAHASRVVLVSHTDKHVTVLGRHIIKNIPIWEHKLLCMEPEEKLGAKNVLVFPIKRGGV